MTYNLPDTSVSHLDVWLPGLLDNPERTIGVTNVNITALNPALAALKATIHLVEGPRDLWKEFSLKQ